MANETVTSNIALVGLQNQLDTVRSEVVSTNSSLQTIGRLIQTDNFEDQRRLIEERNQEKLLAEREIRSIDEEQLRQKVDAAVVTPVKKLEPRLKSTFNGIFAALGSLLGFAKSAVITGIATSAKIGIKSLKGIGSLIKNSLGLIGSILASFSSGFSSVIGGIGKVTSTVLGAIADLAKSPFKAIADAFKNLLPRTPRPNGTPTSPSTSGTGGLPGMFGTGLRIIGSVSSGINAATSAQEGDVIGTGLGALGVFSPIFALGSAAYEMFGSPGKNIDMRPIQDAFTSGAESIKGFLSSSGTNFNVNGINFDSFKATISDMGSNIANSLNSLPFVQKPQSQEENQSTQSTSGPKPIESVPFQAPPPSPPPTPEPESKPDIVYLGGNSNQPSSVASGNSSALTDVPLISSSNPNNFYTLYSQVNYNVVI